MHGVLCLRLDRAHVPVGFSRLPGTAGAGSRDVEQQLCCGSQQLDAIAFPCEGGHQFLVPTAHAAILAECHSDGGES